MSDADIIAVVTAHMAGEKIQYKYRTGDVCWHDIKEDVGWNFYSYDYRVAPEPRKPREWMVVEKGDAICSCWSGDNHIRVREVVENE